MSRGCSKARSISTLPSPYRTRSKQMAGSKSDAFEVEVLKLATGQATSIYTTTPIVPYLALFTRTLSGENTGLTECTGGGYARIVTTGKWAAPTSGAGTVSNNAAIAFAQFTGAVSGPVTAFGLFTDVSAGSALYVGTLTDQTKTFGDLDTANFPSGSIVLTEG